MEENEKIKKNAIETVVKKALQELTEKKINSVFEIIEAMADNKKDMWELNKLLNFAFLSIDLKEMTGFEKEIKPISDREITEIALEKAVILYCILSGIKYEKLSKKDYSAMLKNIPLINHIAKYKLDNFASEILEELGLEMIGKTENGFIIKEMESKKWIN